MDVTDKMNGSVMVSLLWQLVLSWCFWYEIVLLVVANVRDWHGGDFAAGTECLLVVCGLWFRLIGTP